MAAAGEIATMSVAAAVTTAVSIRRMSSSPNDADDWARHELSCWGGLPLGWASLARRSYEDATNNVNKIDGSLDSVTQNARMNFPSVKITPLVTGDYLAPDGRNAGSRVLVVAYLVRTSDSSILFDTGFPWEGPTVHSDPDIDVETFPRSIAAALESAGSSIRDVDVVANCHLHPDHGGGNYRVGTRPIYIQRAEFEAARDPEHAIDWSVELDRANYVVLDGETELMPGVRLVPTPGHTAGHQSMFVETARGTVVLL